MIPPPDRRVSFLDLEEEEEVEESLPLSTRDDSRWLVQFIAVAVVLGLLAVLAITLFA